MAEQSVKAIKRLRTLYNLAERLRTYKIHKQLVHHRDQKTNMIENEFTCNVAVLLFLAIGLFKTWTCSIGLII